MKPRVYKRVPDSGAVVAHAQNLLYAGKSTEAIPDSVRILGARLYICGPLCAVSWILVGPSPVVTGTMTYFVWAVPRPGDTCYFSDWRSPPPPQIRAFSDSISFCEASELCQRPGRTAR